MSELLRHNPSASDFGFKENNKAPLLWQDIVKRWGERRHTHSQMNDAFLSITEFDMSTHMKGSFSNSA